MRHDNELLKAITRRRPNNPPLPMAVRRPRARLLFEQAERAAKTNPLPNERAVRT